MDRRKIFWTGLVIYAASFFLTAVGPSAHPIRGYFCAAFTLVEPFQSSPWRHGGVYDGRPLEYISVIVSGWANPIFIAYAFLACAGLPGILVRISRGFTVAMIPFSWIVFHYEHFYPREGHFLWVAGMMTALFASELAQLFSAGAGRWTTRETAI
jgi:hypothetical protein